jgi:uridine kinase
MITNTIFAADADRPLLVAINDKDASGKTMMAHLLADYLKNQTARPVVRYEVAKQKYIDRYIASQTIYFNEERPANVADIIINNNNVDSPYQVC